MVLVEKISNRFRPLTGPLIAAIVLAYFGYHTIQGERGILTWLQLNLQIEQTKSALATSRAEESYLEKRVALLRLDNLDPDMLDERARIVLNLAAPGEVVIFMDQSGAIR